MVRHIMRNRSSRIIVFLVAFIFTFILTSCSNEPVRPKLIKAFNDSEGLWYQYKLEEAKMKVEEILKKDPYYTDASRKMAFMEYYYYHNYKKASGYIKKAIDKEPKEVQNYMVSGDIYFEEGQYENAIGDYEKVLNLDGENTEIYYSLAQSYIRLGKREEAIRALEKGNCINPFDVKISALLHLLYVEDEEYEKAYRVWKMGNVSDTTPLGYYREWNELYRNALENKSADRHIQLGNLYTRLLLYDEAKLELQRALKDNPNNRELDTKLNEISLFIKFRDELKECFYSYYSRRILNGAGEEYKLVKDVENIYKQMIVLFPDIKYTPLDINYWHLYTLNNEIQRKFNVIINCFPIDGIMGCYFGYIVGDSNEEISHWGKKINIKVTVARNNVINPFINWYQRSEGLAGWCESEIDENKNIKIQNKIILDSRYKTAYDLWEGATNREKRDRLLAKAEESEKDLFGKPSLEIFYSSLLNLRLSFKAMDELIEEARAKFDSDEEVKEYVINHIVYEVLVPYTNLHEGQHAIDVKYYNYEVWEREYRAMMSEPVYGKMQLYDITCQIKPDIGDESTDYGKAHTKIFTDIVNYINDNREDYPAIDTNKNIMMQLSKLSAKDLKEISKNVFEQEYPGERYE